MAIRAPDGANNDMSSFIPKTEGDKIWPNAHTGDQGRVYPPLKQLSAEGANVFGFEITQHCLLFLGKEKKDISSFTT